MTCTLYSLKILRYYFVAFSLKTKLSRNGAARRKAQRQEYKYSLIFNVNCKDEQEKEKNVAIVNPIKKTEEFDRRHSEENVTQNDHDSEGTEVNGAGFYPPDWINFPNPQNSRKYSTKEKYFFSNDNDETEVNGINALPIVSQLKSAVLFVSGNREEARKVQSDFVTTCPVVSQVTSGVQLYKGDTDGAKQTWGRFCNFMNGAVNSIPVIGHVKGAYHKVTGDNDAANEAFLAATRTTGVMAGGIAGIAGGPAGMFAGGIAAGTLVDGVVTKINSTSDAYRPFGVFAAAEEIKDNPTVVGVFDAVAGVLLDGATGLAAGSSVKYTRTKLTRTQLRRFLRKNAKARTKGFAPKPRPTQFSAFKMGRGTTGAGANGGGRRRGRRRRTTEE